MKRPLRLIPILYYMVAYKLVVCIALVPKLLHMDDAARLASEVDHPFLP